MNLILEKLMSEKIFSISSERTVLDGAEEMAQREVGSLLVDQKGVYVGMITEGDIIRKVVARGMDPATVSVGAVMGIPVTIEADQSVIGANDLMRIKKVRHLAVTRNGTIVGVVSVRDLLQAFHMEEQESGVKEFN